jgi:hypothetical protein
MAMSLGADRTFWTLRIAVILCIMVSYKISHLYNADFFLNYSNFPFKVTEMGEYLQKHIAFSDYTVIFFHR